MLDCLALNTNKIKNPQCENLIRKMLSLVPPPLPVFNITWKRTVPSLSSPFMNATGPQNNSPLVLR